MSVTVEKCLQAWTNSLKQMRAKADIVFFGDSLIYYGDFASVFPDKVVFNLGLRGDTIQGMIDRVNQVCLLEPDKLFLMAGINDVASYSETAFGELYDKLVSVILQKLPNSEIIIQSLLPVNDKDFTISCNNTQIEESNKIILSIASNYRLRYVDLFSQYVSDGILAKEYTLDGLHLCTERYKIWYDIIKVLLYNS